MVLRKAFARLHSGHHSQSHCLHHLHVHVLHAAGGGSFLTFGVLEIAIRPRAVHSELAVDVRVNVDTFGAGRAGGEILTSFSRVEERTLFTVFDFLAVGSEAAFDLTVFGRLRLRGVGLGAGRTLDDRLLDTAEASCALVPGRVGSAIIDEIISLAVQFQTALILQIVRLLLDSLPFARLLGLLIRLVDHEVIMILTGLHVWPFLDIEHSRRLRILLMAISSLTGSASCGVNPIS